MLYFQSSDGDAQQSADPSSESDEDPAVSTSSSGSDDLPQVHRGRGRGRVRGRGQGARGRPNIPAPRGRGRGRGNPAPRGRGRGRVRGHGGYNLIRDVVGRVNHNAPADWSDVVPVLDLPAFQGDQGPNTNIPYDAPVLDANSAHCAYAPSGVAT